ncbi:MAG: DUF499 domain-containing protein [Dehalococcoidia bacterium]|nr:DUF499 domain-containing protein [Dehalococcoidia bacterium]
MVKSTYTPWHQVVTLRDDLRTGELTLSIFAADLYDVVMGRARPIYQDPQQFFALTYPTFNLRELVKDVLQRLAGKNEKAVRQLELTYGGGKTHALITLYHLVNEPGSLPDLPAIHEFIQHAGGVTPPKARVAALCFDKLDVEKGMEVHGPNRESRWLRHPWSVLAFQIAGADGLRLLHAEDKDEEREAPPAENLLRDLLAFPSKDGLTTLVLIDEVLMFAREKVGLDPQWRHRLQDFFQALTQAATKVDRACVVASLLATDPRKSDELGKEIAKELYDVFRREKEEGVQPVEKQDVAEVLRRRFFTADSIRDRETFRPHVVAALDGIQALDEGTRKNRQGEEERYLASYPFHPELTEAFYTKWTQLEGFQRTRGVLRTFAMALRDAEKWDTSPLVGTNVLLNAPGQTGLSEAARELASIAATEEYEGKRQEWSAILEGELAKARDVQQEFRALKEREVEQAVMGTFLHSQPIGQRALTRDLLVLLGAAKADKIELEKALRRWTEVSYFLDEAAIAETNGGNGTASVEELPKWWRLGTKPNLRQMHSDACARVPADVIEVSIRDLIAKERRLTAGASAAGARVHNVPERPRDVEDDGEFHYVVLGPRAASESGKPSSEARRFIDETTGPDRPRVYRNAILLVVPSKDGLELVRSRARDYLGWEEVRNLREAKDFDELRKTLLAAYTDEARKRIPDAIVQAYCIVVAVSAKGEVEAFRITPNSEPVFETIKNDKRSRIQESAISPEALLPDGPYALWRDGETSRRASDLTRAFAQFPHLPKMLRQKDIVDTLALGCQQGYFVLRLTRPDKSVRTIWRSHPTENDLTERDLEVALPEASELTHLDGGLLAPGALPGLWPEAAESIAVGDVLSFFDGSHTCKVMREGYEEVFPVPRAAKEVVEEAIHEAVRAGSVWLTAGPASLYREEIPYGVLSETAVLHPPPTDLPATAVLPQNLEAAWRDPVTTAASVGDALSVVAGKTLPWTIVRSAIDAAIRGRLLERTPDSGPWPCDWPEATNVRLRVPEEAPPPSFPRRHVAEAELEPAELQDLVDGLPEIVNAGAGLDLRFVLRLELGQRAEPSQEQLAKLNDALRKACAKLEFGKEQ